MVSDPLDHAWEPAQVEVMEALRDWAVGFAELNQHMAAWMGLPGSDANALGQIVWAAESGEPLSPARLARRLGMTSGATTILLNRLEGAGLIGRTREHADRRRVTLRPSETGRERARAFTAFASTEIAATLRTHGAEELRGATGVLRAMTTAVRRANERLQGS